VISCVFIHDYTENFTNENHFHKIAVSRLGCIAGHGGYYIVRHFVALCTICAWHMAFPIPEGVKVLDTK